MSLRLGTLLLLSGCATAPVVDENSERIDHVLRAQDPIPEPLQLGPAEPIAEPPVPVPRGVALNPNDTPVAPEGYRWVPGRRGPRLMRQPGYFGVEIGEIHTGDVTIDTGSVTSPNHYVRVTSGH